MPAQASQAQQIFWWQQGVIYQVYVRSFRDTDGDGIGDLAGVIERLAYLEWLSVFGGPAWEWDAATEQYYLHSFLAAQPDLNWRNPAVQQAMFDVARFWLERGVDGFRIDVAHLIMKDPALRDNPPDPDPEPIWVRTMGEWATQLHLYDQAHPDVHRVFREFRQLLESYSIQQPRVSIGELHDRDMSIWASYYGAQHDELHMPFNFHLLGADWNASVVRAVVNALNAAVPEGAWPNWVLGNHDQARIASQLGSAQARIAMLLLLTLRGTPTLYYGDELGMRNVPVSPEQAQDPWEQRMPGLGRDPQRTLMQWDAGPNAGFCAPDAVPWLPIAADYQTMNVAAQAEDIGSMLVLTRQLLALRRAKPALSIGHYRTLDGMPDDCLVYLRYTAEQRMLVALNFSSTDRVLELPAVARGTLRISTLGDRDGAPIAERLLLRGDEGCVVELN